MHEHINIGKQGEELAAGWLAAKGFTILSQNWRHSRYEIDIIASRSAVLHIIEVKTRRSESYGRPEESVSKRKFRHIMQGAAGWLVEFPSHHRLQYDGVAFSDVTDCQPGVFIAET